MAADEDALICDFAETYHIYDIRGLSAGYAATLASGLRADARINMKMSGTPISLEQALLAQTVDNMRVLVWMKTEDAEKGRNYPESVLKVLLGEVGQPDAGYDTADEYEKARKRIIEGN